MVNPMLSTGKKVLGKKQVVEYRGQGLNFKKVILRHGTEYPNEVSKNNPDENDELRGSYFIADDFENSFINNLFWTSTNAVISDGHLIVTCPDSDTANLIGLQEKLDNVNKIIFETRMTYTISGSIDFANMGIRDITTGHGAYFDMETAGTFIAKTYDGTLTTGKSIPVQSGEEIYIRIEMSPDKADFYINNDLKDTIKTNISTSQNMGFSIELNTNIGGSIIANFQWISMEFNPQ